MIISKILLLVAFFSLRSNARKLRNPCSGPLGLGMKLRGEPQNFFQIPAPYNFTFTDLSGRTADEYNGSVYKIRLSGETPFRGFLIESRSATAQGFLIRNVTVGHFIPDKRWRNQGIKFSECHPSNDSAIMHSSDKEKFAVEAKWQSSRNEGPVLFVITIIQSQNVYWTQWQPSPAFIFPSKIFIEGRSHDSPEPDTFDSEVRSDFRSAEDDEDALNSPFDSRSESNLPIRKTFAAPRFDVSVKNGKRFQIRVIHSEEKPEKSQEQMPVPPVFPKNWRKSDRFPQPPPFSLVDSDLVNQENDELENPESDSEGLFRVPTTTTPISVAPSVLLAETERVIERIPTPCDSNPCLNNAACRPLSGNNYECICSDLWTGENCNETNHCYKNGQTCHHGALCIENNGTFACQCRGEWVGEFCDRPCPSYLCKNNGTCNISSAGEYGCVCPPGYSGRWCEIDIDDCVGHKCLHGATCVDKINDYDCHCAAGYMGNRCQRPCQDIYKSCDLWGEQGRCESMRAATTFFDVNCAVTCGQCIYKNSTVTTDFPLAPILEPLEFLIGKWTANLSRPYRFPMDFTNATEGYYETLEITAAPAVMFGTPSLNFSAKAYNNLNPSDQQITVGFLTLGPGTKPLKVSLMSTGNEGMTIMEEGELTGNKIVLETVYVVAESRVQKFIPTKAIRHFSIRGQYLLEIVERSGVKGQKEYFTKYFDRAKTDR